MKLRFPRGAPQGPVFLMIGTWDPLTPDHRDILRDLAARATAAGALPAAIIIDPNPSAFIQGVDRWTVFDPPETRLHRLTTLGIDTIGIITFDESDLSAGAPEFFDLIVPMITVDELWLGSQQSLGSGPAGSLDRILTEAKARAIRVSRLPPSRSFTIASAARKQISLGRVATAIDVAGIAPIWHGTRSAPTLTSWPPGLYRALALDKSHQEEIREIAIERADIGRWNRICWPDAHSRYAFFAGPGDTPDRVAMAIDSIHSSLPFMAAGDTPR